MRTIDSLVSLAQAEAGLAYPAVMRPHFESAVAKFLQLSGLDTSRIPDHEQIAADPNLLDQLLDQLTVRETYFFREPSHFALLEQEVIPELQLLKRGSASPRIWSAGCATGEEIYSVAMLLEEMGELAGAELLGSDLSSSALSSAYAARFRKWSFRGEIGRRALAHCSDDGAETRIPSARIRQQVRFVRHNLWRDPVPRSGAADGKWDVIFCRNVLLYFNPDGIRTVLERLLSALRDEGLLLTGAGDPLLHDLPDAEVVITADGCHYRRLPSAKSGVPSPPPRERRDPWPSEVAGNARASTEIPLNRNTSSEQLVTSAVIESAVDVSRVTPRSSVEEAGQDARAHVLSALASLDQGAIQEAAEAARRALYLDPTSPEAHFTQGLVSRRAGRKSDALRAFRATLRFVAHQSGFWGSAESNAELGDDLKRAAMAQIRELECAT